MGHAAGPKERVERDILEAQAYAVLRREAPTFSVVLLVSWIEAASTEKLRSVVKRGAQFFT
jgi:hypothetical protein